MTRLHSTRFHSERGSALLITLALMLLLTGIAMVAVNESTTDVQLSFNQMHEEQAFYTAEAGVRRAIGVRKENPGWNAGYTAVPLNGGSYSVVVTDSASNPALQDTVVFTGVGFHDGAKATVEITTVPDINRPFQYAMFGEEYIEIKNSAVTDSYHSDSGSYTVTVAQEYGDVGSNGEIDFKAAAIIGGDVTTAQNDGLTLYPGAVVMGDSSTAADEVSIPPIPAEEFTWAKANNDNMTGMSGHFTYSPASFSLRATSQVTLTSGVYYFSSIDLGNGARLRLAPGAEVTIYVTGDIFIGNGASVNDGGHPADLQIYSGGDLNLINSGDFYGSFYSPTGEADLRNAGDFYGSIISYRTIVHNSAGFHFDRALLDVTRDDGQLRAVSWAELE